MTKTETQERLTNELLDLFQFSTPKRLRRSLQKVIMEFIAEQDPELIDRITIQDFQSLMKFLDTADELCNTILEESNSEDDRRIENG